MVLIWRFGDWKVYRQILNSPIIYNIQLSHSAWCMCACATWLHVHVHAETKRAMALYRFFQCCPNVVHVWGLFSFYEGVRASQWPCISRVLCPGDSESAKLTPRAHYNNYTAKERAEIGKYAAEGLRACGNAIRNSPKFKIAKLYTYPILTVLPNLMATKVSRYTVILLVLLWSEYILIRIRKQLRTELLHEIESDSIQTEVYCGNHFLLVS